MVLYTRVVSLVLDLGIQVRIGLGILGIFIRYEKGKDFDELGVVLEILNVGIYEGVLGCGFFIQNFCNNLFLCKYYLYEVV